MDLEALMAGREIKGTKLFAALRAQHADRQTWAAPDPASAAPAAWAQPCHNSEPDG